uniref:Troponin I, fast skeletal muscle-like n=1 Tax=Echeneis naucrates TaxID=173247 RepID=A0A665TGA8_ECHNA
MFGKKMTSSRKHHLKSLMLQIAAGMIEQEKKELKAVKEAYMAENCPAPSLSGDQAALMVICLLIPRQEICKKIHQAIDKIDEARYDAEAKVQKADKEIEDLKLKVIELAGVKKPALKKVRMSADAMLQALLGGKHKVNMDLRANLKQVKKEVKEEPTEAVGDWRKNIEDKADRKKMFETS